MKGREDLVKMVGVILGRVQRGVDEIPGTFWSRVLATFLKRLSAKNLISDKSVGPYGWAQAHLAWPLLNRHSFFLTGGLCRRSKNHIIDPHDCEGGGLIVCPIISAQITLFSAKFEMVFTHNPFPV